MLTNSVIKSVAALGTAKHRRGQCAFIAEGTRCVTELLPLLPCRMVIATAQWLRDNAAHIANTETIIAEPSQIKRMSQQQSPQPVIGVFEMPRHQLDLTTLAGKLVLALDSVQDPGNMGTIVRVADWFGIDTILCSTTTVDVFNPKVVQATMGAIGRVKVFYTDLAATLARLSAAGPTPIYGTFLDGTDIYGTPLTPHGIIVMGNEGNGISPQVAANVNRRLLIPPYPADSVTVESLNVGVATAITVAEFRRRYQLNR